jgi:Amt family ammonium transporter
MKKRILVALLTAALLSPAVVFADEAAFDAKAAVGDLKVVADTVWTLIAAFLVFWMNAGFAMVESGLCRQKNCVNILAKNFIVFAISSIAFWVIGWDLMFGGDGAGIGKFIGNAGTCFVSGSDAETYKAISWAAIPLWAKFFFQLVFAGTAATIVSGAVAERIKFLAFIVFSFILVGVMYPVTGHWLWGGGWLSTKMLDFAGSTVVHSVGGWAALAGVLVLGPRIGKYSKEGKVQPIPGHNMSNATLGCLILWLGWFGFNPGSTMAAVPHIAHIAVTTNTAAAFAILTATMTSWMALGKPDLSMILNGCLAGLVAITAPCAFVTVGASAIIGAMAGILVVLSVIGFDKLKIDDPVGALSVHLVCGVFGTLCVGLFGSEAVMKTAGIDTTAYGYGLLMGGGAKLLLGQLLGVLAVGAHTFGLGLIAWTILKATVGIRVDAEEEITGLDVGEHGNEAYPDFVGATERG